MSDVNKIGGGSHYDNEESFLFAEVMKYAYLVHAEGKLLTCVISILISMLMMASTDAPWQVQRGGKNAFVFNTEAHPFKVSHT